MNNKMDATMRLMDEIDSLREVARSTSQDDDVELLARVREVYASQGLEADETIFAQAFHNLYGRAPGAQPLVVASPQPDMGDKTAVSPVEPVSPPPASAVGAVVLFFMLATLTVGWLAFMPQGAIMGQVTGPSFVARTMAYWSQFSTESAAAFSVFKTVSLGLAIPVAGLLAWKTVKRVSTTLVRWMTPAPPAVSKEAVIVVASSSRAYPAVIKHALDDRYQVVVTQDANALIHACKTLPDVALALVDADFADVLESQSLNGVRAVIFVGALDAITQQQALELPGVVGVLSKPLVVSEVKAMAWEHVGRAQMHDTVLTAFSGPF